MLGRVAGDTAAAADSHGTRLVGLRRRLGSAR